MDRGGHDGQQQQKVDAGKQTAGIEMRYGKLALNVFTLDRVEGTAANLVKVELDGRPVDASLRMEEDRYVMKFEADVTIRAGQRVEFSLGWK